MNNFSVYERLMTILQNVLNVVIDLASELIDKGKKQSLSEVETKTLGTLLETLQKLLKLNSDVFRKLGEVAGLVEKRD